MPRKMSDLDTMPKKIMKSEQAPEKGPGKHRKRVRAGTEKGRIRASAGKVESGRVPEKGSGEYRERVESERVPEMWNLGEYQRRVRVSTGEG